MSHSTREKLIGLTNRHDALSLIEVVDGIEAISHYNDEITGFTPGLQELPEIGKDIHYGSNAYYVLRELAKRGFVISASHDLD